ncbi:MAG: helix-turn-helix domain-containing protein [Acidobacteriota bacterium]
MSDKSELISKLSGSVDTRTAYIKSKLGVLVPSQIRALRLRSQMPRQADLAHAAGLHQSRISTFETPGAANMTLETLARLAATFKVGLKVQFVSMSEMLRWESRYSQDTFSVTPLGLDRQFLGHSLDAATSHPQIAGLRDTHSNETGGMKIQGMASYESFKTPESQQLARGA